MEKNTKYFSWQSFDGELKISKLKIYKLAALYFKTIFAQEYVFMFKFFQFFRGLDCDFRVIYYLLDSKYNYIWDIIGLSSNKNLYYLFLLKVTIEYKKLWKLFNNSKALICPSSYLISSSSKHTSSSLLEQNFSKGSVFFLKKKTQKNIKKLKSYIYTFPHMSKFQKLWLKTSGFDYSLNFYTVHFLRVQRRYNKRRYSKVRLYSRPSFFGGICLGSVFISCFWGGTIKSVDWYITTPIVVNMNLVLTFVFLLILNRVLMTDFSINSLHNFAKIRIYRFLRFILNNQIIQLVLKLR
jgi:hypothetical protein